MIRSTAQPETETPLSSSPDQRRYTGGIQNEASVCVCGYLCDVPGRKLGSSPAKSRREGVVKMAVTVPNNSIVTFAGIEKVIVVQNGKALEKPITTGRRNNEFTEIVAGINVGEKIVVDPGNLQSGQAVEVVD